MVEKKEKKKEGLTIIQLVELKERMLKTVSKAIEEFERATGNISEVQAITITRESSIGENDKIMITNIVDADIKFRL